MCRNWKGVGAAFFSPPPISPSGSPTDVLPSASCSAFFIISFSICVERSILGFLDAGPTYSRQMVKCGSCVASESMIKSASRPWMTWRVLAS